MKVASKSITFFTLLLVLLTSVNAFAKPVLSAAEVADTSKDGQKGDPVNTEKEIEEYIQHHLKDSHDFHLFSYFSDNGEEHHVGFPLPVMLWGENGFTAFMSSAFHHDDNGQVV